MFTPPRSDQLRTHWWPRSRDGRIATAAFVALLLLAEPPAVYLLANRITPRIAGVPFLFVYLLIIYAAMIAVMLWARSRKL
ncbi:MAG: hypothetical protein ACREM1_05320 [Longimicrobiales bacterium]